MKHTGNLLGLSLDSSAQLGVAALDMRSSLSTLLPGLKALLSAGEALSAASGGVDCLCVSGSTGMGLFLKGSLEESESAGLLRAPPPTPQPLLLSGAPPLFAGHWSSKVSVPVHAGGAGDPLDTRSSMPDWGLHPGNLEVP